MTLDDIKAVHSIDQLSFSIPWPERSYHYEIMDNPSSSLWVAETKYTDGVKHVVGMIVVWVILDEAHIATLAVHPNFRRQGIAKKLLNICLIDAIKRGLRVATLEVRASNQAAQELYKDFGFVIAGRRPKYYRDNNEDALIMTLHGIGFDYLNRLKKHDASNIQVKCTEN